MFGSVGDKALDGKRVLVVEDESMLAHDLMHELGALGATVVGPCGTVTKALHALDACVSIDIAVLDISLRERFVYDVADRLTDQGVPIVFATGFDASVIPERYRAVPRCEKPAPFGAVSALVAKILAA